MAMDRVKDPIVYIPLGTYIKISIYKSTQLKSRNHQTPRLINDTIRGAMRRHNIPKDPRR